MGRFIRAGCCAGTSGGPGATREGDKVVRWIARPTLMKGRAKGLASTEDEDGAAGYTAPSRLNGFAGLRIVSDT